VPASLAVSESFAAARAILMDAIAARAFPAASAEVGRPDGAIWHAALGGLTYDPSAAPATPETIFDLASLTKVIATTTLAMRAADAGRLSLDDRVADRLEPWRGRDREMVTIRDLLAHCAGLTAYLPFYRDLAGRQEFEPAICSLPLEYEPRTQAVYSDLGFMLLAFILADVWGMSFEASYAQMTAGLSPALPTFLPLRALRDRIAPTTVDAWRGRLLVGEVHDENAWALGGAAGHSGLFGTASDVGRFARLVLRTLRGEAVLARPDTVRMFARRTDVPGSSRALGWDTMLPTSSCGRLMAPTAIGHTGFTGTTLWIDHERGVYVVLLTNRVHPDTSNEAIRHIRPLFHDAVIQALP
jgi:CubicO group peptidase (beta-lactamase class C family)